MRTIFLLRHGETQWNTEQRLQGHKDSPLTTLGRQQAQLNGAKLNALPLGDPIRLISSPLGRALQTAGIIAEQLGIDPSRIETDARLKEICFGAWEGMTRSEIKTKDTVTYQARAADRWNVRPPDGESYRDVADRLTAWLSELGNGRFVVVSHGCTGRILRVLHAGLGTDQVDRLDERHDAIFQLHPEGLITEVGFSA